MTAHWTRHRARNARACDRCRRTAVWNLSRLGHRLEYACAEHAQALAAAYGIDGPPADA